MKRTHSGLILIGVSLVLRQVFGAVLHMALKQPYNYAFDRTIVFDTALILGWITVIVGVFGIVRLVKGLITKT
jgi:hypothetical protein